MKIGKIAIQSKEYQCDKGVYAYGCIKIPQDNSIEQYIQTLLKIYFESNISKYIALGLKHYVSTKYLILPL